MKQPHIFYYFRLFLFIIFFSFPLINITYAGVIVGTSKTIVRGEIPTITWAVTGIANCDRDTNYNATVVSNDGIATARHRGPTIMQQKCL